MLYRAYHKMWFSYLVETKSSLPQTPNVILNICLEEFFNILFLVWLTEFWTQKNKVKLDQNPLWANFVTNMWRK